MTKKIKRISLLTVLACSFALPSAVNATNGLFMSGFGTISRGMGGTAIAYPADAISGVANPANISHVGRRFDIGADFFTADVTGQLGSVSADSNPDLFGVEGFCDAELSIK